jgi:hypothetical protein
MQSSEYDPPPQGTAVCMNIGEFRARFRKVKPDVRGDVLSKYMVTDKGVDLASILKPQKHSWRGRKADCKCRHCDMVRSFDSTTRVWAYRLDDKEIGVHHPDYTGKFDEPKCTPSRMDLKSSGT